MKIKTSIDIDEDLWIEFKNWCNNHRTTVGKKLTIIIKKVVEE